MSDTTANVTEFKSKARREFRTKAKAQVIGQLLAAQGFGVRIHHSMSVTEDAFGTVVKSNVSSRSMFTLSTDASWDSLNEAIRDYDRAAAEVTTEAVKAKLAEVSGE